VVNKTEQREIRFSRQSADVLVIGGMTFVAHIKDGYLVFVQEDVRTYQDMVCVNAKEIVAGAYLS
jgi:hypothetical protein